MIFMNVIELSKSINHDRKEMYKLAEKGDLLNPAVIQISQNLDEKIVTLQKILYKIHS